MYIKKFQEIQKNDVELAGGKGANLGEMVHAGMHIPEGFVITSEGYRAYMKENGIADWFDTKIREVSGKEESLLMLAKELRQKIMEGKMPEGLQQELQDAYKSMGTQVRVAVRSSATAEDLADASFAGQQETYLNVQEKELLEKIKECYASLWGKRALLYRERQGYDHREVALAVVVQKMVESEVAGVLFTCNPANQNINEIQINASFGLGESVVSGRVTPDEYICDRSGRLLRRVIGSKDTEIVYDRVGTKEQAVAEERRKQSALSKIQIKELVKNALEIEAHYHCPMDIEWAIEKDKVYILQARAITTLSEKKEEQEEIPEMKVTGRVKKLMTFMLEKNPYAYYPLDYSVSMILGVEKERALHDAGIDMDMEMHMDDDGMMTLPSGKIGFNHEILHIGRTIREWLDGEKGRTEATCRIDKNWSRLKELEKLSVEDMGLNECTKLWEDLYQLMADNGYARFRYALFPSMLIGRSLEKVLGKLTPKRSGYDLLKELPYKTAMINCEMQTLVEEIWADKKLADAVLAGISYSEILQSFPEIKPSFDLFLKNNGYKSDFNCYCFIAVSWNENPNRLLQVLRPMLLAKKENSLQSVNAEEKNGYERLLKEIENVAGKKKFVKIKQSIEHYRFCHIYREETQYLWEEAFALRRRLYRQTERLLSGVLPAGELMYLFYPEMIQLCMSGEVSREQMEMIERRKAKRSIAEKTWEKAQMAVLMEGNHDAEVIKGVCGSFGETIGSVCVVANPGEFYKLKKGDVLVCKYTDPEWTPLFTLASAVVSDTGGALSHAAIVAREYGIPAVLGTGIATMQLKDGDKIIVSADKGEVRKIG